jgi:hypothetical protein
MKRLISLITAWVLIVASCSFAASEPSITGTYINKADKEVLTLYPDGRVYLKLRKKPTDPANPFLEVTGTYKMKGDELLLELEGGGEASGTIKGNTFVDNEGKTWQKEGTKEPMQVDPGPKKGLRAK